MSSDHMVNKRTAYISAVLVTAAIIILYLLIPYLYFQGTPAPVLGNGPVGNFPIGRISIDNSSYNVYVAANQEMQQLGYMNATGIGNCDGLNSCAGMLFIFNNESRECFWMKNTLIALKQSWISYDKVNYTYLGTPLSTGIVCSPGSMVLETLPDFPINVSDTVSFLGAYNRSL